MAKPLPAPTPLNGLAISRGTLFAASLRHQKTLSATNIQPSFLFCSSQIGCHRVRRSWRSGIRIGPNLLVRSISAKLLILFFVDNFYLFLQILHLFVVEIFGKFLCKSLQILAFLSQETVCLLFRPHLCCNQTVFLSTKTFGSGIQCNTYFRW